MKNCILFLLLISSITIHAQTQLLPYLKNDRYCLSDENGKIIIDGAFDEIKFEREGKLIFIKKEGRWGVLSSTGVPLLPFVLRSYYIGNTFLLSSRRTNKNVPSPELIKIEDKRTQLIYYINPNKILPKYKTFIPVSEVREGRRSSPHNDYPSDGMVKVGTSDMKINFIDTTGQVIFKDGVYDGLTISDQFLSIQNTEGKHALFNNKNKRLTDFNYHKLTVAKNESYIKGEIKVKEGNSTKRIFSLLDKNGNEIISGKTSISFIDDEIFIANNQDGGGIYRHPNEEIYYHPKGKIESLDYVNPNRFKLTVPTGLGIINQNGDVLLEPIYNRVKKVLGNKYIFLRDKEAGFFSSNFKELWTIDSVQINTKNYYNKGIFRIDKYANYKLTMGLVDSLGQIIIPPKYKKVKAAGCNLIEVKLDSMTSLVTLEEKTIIPFTTDKIQVNCEDEFIKVWNRIDIQTYDLNGNFLEKKKMESLVQNRRNGPPKLYDKNGTELDKSLYRSIFDNHDKKGNQRIFFGRHKDKTKRNFTSIFNEKGIEVSPPKYGLPDNFTHSKTGKNGGIIVVHKKDAIQRKRPFRSGVINFEGDWIIRPDYQITTVFGNELFLTKNFQKGKAKLYNRYGKEISKKPYTSFEERAQDKIYNNRIVVGYITNKKEYLKSLENLQKLKSDADPEIILKEMEKVVQKKHQLGYIDLDGNEIIEPQYLIAKPFRNRYTTVTGINNEKEIYSAVIDLNGKSLLTTDYEELNIMLNDTTILSAKKNGLWGMIDLSGNILVNPKYETINLTSYPNIFYCSDSLSNYLIRNNTVIKNIGPKGRVDIGSLKGDYFFTKVNAKVDENDGHQIIYNIFDKDGNHFQEIKAAEISASIFKFGLPEGFVSVKKNKKDKPYLMNFKTGKELKNSLF